MVEKDDTMKIDLNFKEFCLIFAIRNKFRFGDVIIKMRDGVPIRILHAFESDELEKPTLTKQEE